jgi:pyruvate dehydrogenase E1 component
MSSFIAAGTAYATHGVSTIPFFMFYSMFGFQRIGDLIWAAGDMRCRGFLLGGTAGRTTLAGEGLQHQDGHSHLLAFPHPTVMAYDPAYAYEIAVIVREGIRRMFVEGVDCMYYLTLGNELYPMPGMAEGVEEGILRGIYRLSAPEADGRPRVRILGSGALLNMAVQAAETLAKDHGVAAEVFSVTSYQQLHRNALETDRWNRLHPAEAARVPYVRACLGDDAAPIVAVSDYVRALPASLARWLPGPLTVLGTDGFGRSEGRAALRAHFEVDARHVTAAALSGLAREGRLDPATAADAIRKLGIDPDRPDPMYL